MADILGDMRRTHHCNALTAKDMGKEVVLMGWVLRRRDHGGVIFIDLRDREGITQVVFNPEINPDVHAKAHGLRSEFVLGVRGRVEPRPEGMINSKLPTGEIEVLVDELKILNLAKTPPFMIEDKRGCLRADPPQIPAFGSEKTGPANAILSPGTKPAPRYGAFSMTTVFWTLRHRY